jgi:hypothetical protein
VRISIVSPSVATCPPTCTSSPGDCPRFGARRKLPSRTLWIGLAAGLTISAEEPTTHSEFGLDLCCGGQVRDPAEMRHRGCGEQIPELVRREDQRCHSEGIGEPCDMLILADGNGGREPNDLGDAQEDVGIPHERAEGMAAPFVSSDDWLVRWFTNGDPQVFGPPLPDVQAFPRTDFGLDPVVSSLHGPEVRRRSQLLGHRPDRAGFVEYDVGVEEQNMSVSR